MKQVKPEIFKAAKELAKNNADSEPNIEEIYLFPSDEKILLIEIDPSAMPSGDVIAPFYFPPDPDNNIPFFTGIALIPPEDKKKFNPPPKWGRWEDAILIWPEEVA